ncbi:helix-turn-helix domain-containing protein [Tepidibacter hydrothermalis]|uniref:Helix-turn-helix transcriptional regulator n=1 Tax=Tepidibacter hydrothermalis TaxID=3036126 RepID=A0ABY8EA49_9FIRM|nr:helix-turn-helix transcriptional regulator [Tepidibacter hydrothermalis]
MAFAERMKQLRKEKGLTQEELAVIISKNRSTIAGYETERKEPDHDTLKKIADYFEVSIDYLLGQSDIKTTTNIETKAYHNLDVGGLSEEAIKQIEDYIEFVKQKYNPDGTLKKK